MSEKPAPPPAPSLLPSTSRPVLDLDGSWSFALDPTSVGIEEGWSEADLGSTITVPGSWEEQGFGERPPEFIGGWTKRRSYEGVAWYNREVTVPADWSDSRVWLQLDRVGWESTVYVDGQRIGREDSLSAPHRFDLSGAVRPGATHRIAIRVNNALPGVLNFEGHIHSRHTATTWGGIVGHARLVATASTWIEQLAVYPDAVTRSARVVVRLAGAEQTGNVRIAVGAGETALATAEAEVRDQTAEVALGLGESARLWSDEDPFLHDITVDYGTDSVHDRFGLRTFATSGRDLTLNGVKVFLRGYVDCCIFPLTGYPPEDKEVYRAQFAKARAWGFNHVRLHSWTPSRVFFEAADEAGMLVQTELPNWGNCNSDDYLDSADRSTGEGTADELPTAREFLRAELDRIVPHLQRHPSLVIHAMGNELLQKPEHGAGFRYSPFLNELVRHGREQDPSRLYTDQSGFGHVPEEAERETDLFVLHTFRGSTPDTTATWQEKIAGGKTPVIAHEHTQMDMYARLTGGEDGQGEISKFTGVMEPSWLLQAREGLASKGLLDKAEHFVDASGALQARCLKELFERLRRTPGLAGVQMLNFTDFPGQGTALNGVLDVFWDEKGHVEAEEFRTYNAQTVLLCSAQRRSYPTGGFLEAEIAVSAFSAIPPDGHLHWSLTSDDGKTIAEGSEPLTGVRLGHPTTVAAVSVQLPSDRSRKVTLTASVDGVARNSWDFWVFDDTRRQQPAQQVRVRPTVKWLADYYPAM